MRTQDLYTPERLVAEAVLKAVGGARDDGRWHHEYCPGVPAIPCDCADRERILRDTAVRAYLYSARLERRTREDLERRLQDVEALLAWEKGAAAR